jgi:tetratricopeptide (TPR) repeat protein
LQIITFSACQTKTDFEKLYSDANDRLKEGNYGQAIVLFDKAISLNSSADSLYTLKGFCFYQLGDYKNCIKLAERALILNPNNYYAYYLIGVSRPNINIYDQIKHKLYSDNFNSGTIDGKFYTPYNIWYSSTGSVEKVVDIKCAIKDLSKSIELFDTYAESYNERGKLYREIKAYERALKDFNKAIELMTNEAEFYYQRALLLKELGKTDLSLHDFNKAIELEQNPFFYSNRGYLKREQLNDEKGACEDMKMAEKLGLPIDDEQCK